MSIAESIPLLYDSQIQCTRAMVILEFRRRERDLASANLSREHHPKSRRVSQPGAESFLSAAKRLLSLGKGL